MHVLEWGQGSEDKLVAQEVVGSRSQREEGRKGEGGKVFYKTEGGVC